MLNTTFQASISEPNFQHTFSSDHYEQLLNIKAKHDPVDRFVIVEGMGSEKWDGELVCRL